VITSGIILYRESDWVIDMENIMECQRRFTRVQGHSASCILVNSDGRSYQATLENISIGGALIKIREGAPNSLNIGDECTVTLCNGTGPLPSHYTCNVVWYNSGRLGIQFITQQGTS